MDIGFWIAVAALLLGAVLYLIEVLNPGFFLAVPGTVLLVMGMLGIFWPSFIWSPWSLLVLPISAGAGTGATLFMYKRFAPPDLRPTTLASDSLVGREGRLKAAIPPDGRGVVRIEGQDWRAVSEWPLAVGTLVKVVRVDGLTLVVEEIPKETI